MRTRLKRLVINKIVIWGGSSVGNPTLQRFFALHYLLPFVLAALVIMHLIALHEHGSSNPLGITGNIDRLPFSPYFVFKDLVTVFVFLTVYSSFVFFSPNSLGQKALIKKVLILNLISQCAKCWKYWGNILNYNKTKFINDLYLIMTCNIYYKYNTNILLIKYYANPNLVRYYYKWYNQQITKIMSRAAAQLLLDISETTRTQKIIIWLMEIAPYPFRGQGREKDPLSGTREIKKLLRDFNLNNLDNEKYNFYNKSNNLIDDNNYKISNTDQKFNQWLAGLIDGDGCLLVSKQGYTSCEITVGLEDEKMLRIIQNKLGGNIKPRSGVKALRYRLQNKEGMINLINRINGNIRNSKRLPQLHKVCTVLNIDIINPIPLTINNAWFSGFFDADGTINYYYRDINNKSKIRPQLTISVTNKYLIDVEEYKNIFGGNIYYDKAQNGYYKWCINNEEFHTIYYNYNKNNPSKSFKGNRLFLIKEFYSLYNIKAFRKADDSLIFKSWLLFDKKWNKYKKFGS